MFAINVFIAMIYDINSTTIKEFEYFNSLNIFIFFYILKK